MNYESPVELVVSQMYTTMREEHDRQIIQSIQQCGVNVDKDELIKALQYDRNQYDKGFQDGVKALAEALKSHYPHSNSVLKRIDVLEQELIGGESDA